MLPLLVLIVCAAASPAPPSIPKPALSTGWHIIGGNEVSTPGKWPWQCSLQLNGGHFCGCSYLGNDWVLTTAQCVERQSPSSFTVVFGAHDIISLTQGSPETIYVNKVISHENYNDGTAVRANDIALLKLTKKPRDTEFVAAAKLAPNDGETYVDHECFFTGWGQDGIDTYVNILKEASMDVISSSNCSDLWSPREISENHICLRDCPDLVIRAYLGDSGGPAQCKKNGEWLVVGVMSFNAGGGTGHYPNVYTRVSSYYDWIMEKSNNLS